jgi:outer membrane protein OmpU
MEINMKNITKVGLSALAGALAFTSVQAGSMSLSGSMEATYTKKGNAQTTQPLGMDKELSVTGSGELDNGVGVAYKQTITDAMAYNDSELVFTGVPMLGDASIALTSTGSPISAIDDVTPTAFEEANAAVGSIDDVNGSDGTYGIRYTLADAFGSGVKVDAMYFFQHGAGDANADNGVANAEGGKEDGYEITLQGSVPGVDGLSLGAGYALLNNSDKEAAAVSNKDQQEGTVYAKYSVGAFSFGAQKSIVDVAAANNVTFDTEYYGISYAVSDNLSLSYNEIESTKESEAGEIEQDLDSISISYTMGGMTIGILDADSSNDSYSVGSSKSARSVSMSIAF